MKNGFESLFVPFEPVMHTGKGTALVFAPHPDDEVIGCGGAIIRHVQNNDPVHVIIVTDGSLGDPDLVGQIKTCPDQGRQDNTHAGADQEICAEYGQDIIEYIEARKEESRKAGIVLGYGTPLFLEIGDRTLEYGEKYVNLALKQIKNFSPCIVYAPSIYEMHPDHRALAMIVLEAVRRSESNPELIMYEVGRPIPGPDLLLDITDIVDIKLEAIKCFKTQLKVNPFDEYSLSLNRFRSYTLPSDVKSAEAYNRIKLTGKRQSVVDLFFSESEFQRQLGLYPDIRLMPLVTVIVRTIGRYIFLKKALNSIALQTYPNIEVIIVDAGGDLDINTDDLSDRFKTSVFTENRPLQRSEAANAGLDHARGDYIIFLDDDDWIEGSHIAQLAAAAEEHPDFHAFYSGTRCVDQKGNDAEILFNYQYDRVRLHAVNYLPIHSVMFKKTLLDNGCRFDEELMVYEDWDFWLQVSGYTDFFHVDNISAVYRISRGEGSGVHNYSSAEKGRKIIFRKWKDSISEEVFYALMEYAQEHEELKELKHEKKKLNRNLSKLLSKNDEYEKMLSLFREKEAALSLFREKEAAKDEQILAMDKTIAELTRILDRIHTSKLFRFYRCISAPFRFLKTWKNGK